MPNTTYYVRAYAKNSKGTVYGEQKTIVTLASTGTECGLTIRPVTE